MEISRKATIKDALTGTIICNGEGRISKIYEMLLEYFDGLDDKELLKERIIVESENSTLVLSRLVNSALVAELAFRKARELAKEQNADNRMNLYKLVMEDWRQRNC